MNQSEKNIDVVMRGLRDVEADGAMELRVMKALRAAEMEQPVAATHWLWSWRAMSVGAAVCAAIVVGGVMLRQPGKHTAADHAVVSGMDATVMPKREAEPVIMERMPKLQRPARLTSKRDEVAASQAAVDSQTQSFPAPPMPLTQQERLLLKLAHRDDPVQLAQLSPAARATRFAEDKEEVRAFFTPPPLLDQTPQPVVNESGGTQ